MVECADRAVAMVSIDETLTESATLFNIENDDIIPIGAQIKI